MKSNMFKKMMNLLFQDKKKSSIMIIFLVLSSIFVSIAPHLQGKITDTIVEGIGLGAIKWEIFIKWVVVFLIVSIFQFVTKWVAGWISVRISSDVSYNLRYKVEQKIWKLPLNYYDTTKKGDIMSIITNDVDNVVSTLNQTGGDMVYYVLMLVGMIVMMIISSWQLALATIIIVPVSAFIVKKITTKSAPKYKMQWYYMGQINANVEESFNGHNLINSYGTEDDFINKFKVKNEKLYSESLKAMIISNLVQPISRFLTNINYVIVALFGALKIVSGTMTVGGVLAFIQYSRQFQQPFGQLSSMFAAMQSGMASLERIYAFLDETEEIEDKDILYEDYKFNGELEFKNVSFSYVPDKKLIENMNLKVKPGQMVAIVGGTGAGKTTLVNLIERFYEINSGQILLDGKVPLNSISRATLRENIGMVLQDTWLYQGTIQENIMYSVPNGREVTEEEFLDACKATFVDNFVRSLPEGYDTVVSNELTSVSAGEKQLLTIARAFLLKANVLILDEATSSVDTRTEALIQKALNRLREGRTSFVIAHRLSTIRNADIILVMEKGHIIEQGNHKELLKKNGAYAELYKAQFEQ